MISEKEKVHFYFATTPVYQLVNTAPVVHPCGAKQHQFSEFWFLRVALLFSRTEIEYAISQHYSFVENVGFQILALHQAKPALGFTVKAKIKLNYRNSLTMDLIIWYVYARRIFCFGNMNYGFSSLPQSKVFCRGANRVSISLVAAIQ